VSNIGNGKTEKIDHNLGESYLLNPLPCFLGIHKIGDGIDNIDDLILDVLSHSLGQSYNTYHPLPLIVEARAAV
jgi:hypothetical protein